MFEGATKFAGVDCAPTRPDHENRQLSASEEDERTVGLGMGYRWREEERTQKVAGQSLQRMLLRSQLVEVRTISEMGWRRGSEQSLEEPQQSLRSGCKVSSIGNG
jgi:hypothetical protein